MAACGYTNRKSTISQKIPKDWYELTIASARDIRTKLKEFNPDHIVSADETFVKFHETSDKVLSPIGAKRVGAAVKVDEKAGCTLMVTMDMYGSLLLPPFVIFNGVFAKRLMNEW